MARSPATIRAAQNHFGLALQTSPTKEFPGPAWEVVHWTQLSEVLRACAYGPSAHDP